MNYQVDVDIVGEVPSHCAGAPGTAEVAEAKPITARWLLCDHGMPVAEGTAYYVPSSGRIDWDNDEAPPAKYYGAVVFEIDRAVKRRQAYLGK